MMKILEELGIPKSMLPQARPSSEVYGMADESYFGKEIPIGGAAGDQQAALFGQTCFTAGRPKIHMEQGISVNEYRNKTSIF